jgi:hypothetical protein
MKRLLICFCVSVCAVLAVSGAEPPMVTDRPDQSDSPFVLSRGVFQIEGGGFYGQRDQGGEKLTLRGFPAALLRFGVTEAFELRLGVPGIAVQTTDSATGTTRVNGLVDATLGFKVKIVEQSGAVPHTAFVGTLLVPSGDEEFTSDRIDPGFRFAFSNSLTEAVSLTYNVGVFWLTERNQANLPDTRSFFDWTFTAGVSVSPKLAALGELYGVTTISAEGRPLTSAGAGATYLITPRVQVDGRLTVGLSSAALDWSVGVGVSYRFPRFNA